MKLTPNVANEITRRARLVLDRQVVVTDEQGRVTTGEQTGKVQVDALRACQEGKVIRSSIDDTNVSWCPFVYEQQTIGVFGIIEDGAHVTPEAVSLLQGLAEVITHQYFLMEHVQPSATMQAKFFKQLLTSNSFDAQEAYRQADILQLNLRAAQAIIIAQIDDFEAYALSRGVSDDQKSLVIQEQAEVICEHIREAFRHNSENIVCYVGNNTFIISKGIGGSSLTTRNTMRFLREKADYTFNLLKQKLPAKLTITEGVGQYYPDLGGLRKSYHEARLSLAVGSKVWGPGRVYHIKKVGMFVTLANIGQEHKAELAHQILHPLLQDDQLYKTVQTFLSSGLNLTSAAEKLHIHRNTLIYRLDKTKKAIGLDPRIFDDALQIKLGLMFYQEA